MVDSSGFHPAPMPNRKRPPQASSRVATCLAVRIGLRSGIRQQPIPSLMWLGVAPGADAKQERAAASVGEGGQLVGSKNRIAFGDQADSGPKIDVAGRPPGA